MTEIHESSPDPHHDIVSKTVFGFWVYLLTDFMMFATLFATYAVLRNPSIKGLFSVPFAMGQTLLLLGCSLTSGLGELAARQRDRRWTFLFWGLTFGLGTLFLRREWLDLSGLVQAGHGWRENGFLSAFFTLIGTHAVHMVFALLWILVLLWFVWKRGFNSASLLRLTCLKMFWQFLNIIWIFIFAIVYLMGSYGG